MITKPLVSVSWLTNNLDHPNLVVLDASIAQVTISNDAKLSEIQIPTARFFDIKQIFSDTSGEFPNTLPSEEQFMREAQKLGIYKNSLIVVYDEKGFYSSARAWWLFKAMGHSNIAILDGGLPEWLSKNGKVENKTDYKGERGDFVANYNSAFIKNFEQIESTLKVKNAIIIDARSVERFTGAIPEPHEGLRSGEIPGSLNLPYSKLLNGYTMRSKKELKNIFEEYAKKEDSLIFTCGSGITACILALGASIAGYDNLSVYDGSWTEYGNLTSI
jgi:thiosulfate/3-mercaptopyruvate sulfurtransferase